MGKSHVLLDADGVLLNWELGLKQFMQSHPVHGHTETINEHAYDLASRYNMSVSDVNDLVQEFHTSASFEHLQPLPGAVSAVKHLAEWFPLVVITACGTHPQTAHMRRKNLEHVFGAVFEQVWLTDTFEEKNQYLAQYAPSYWVEDHGGNAELGLKFGHTCMLVNAPHNQADWAHEVIRVDNLLEAALIMLSQSRPR